MTLIRIYAHPINYRAHSDPTARDRDRLRQEILERMGWRGRIHRVWSTAWILNPQAELERIERAIRSARIMPREVETQASRTPEVPAGEATVPLTGRDQGERPVTSAGEQPLFATYAEADLHRFIPETTDLRGETPALMAKLVAAVVIAEAPVHVDVIIDRIRRIYGLQRAGRRVRDAVLMGVKEAVERQKARWLPQMKSSKKQSEFVVVSQNCQCTPRGALRDGTVRNVDQLCDQEIAEGILRVVRAMVGASKDEVIITTARAFGYARTGQQVEGRIADVVNWLLATHRLAERVGSLVLPA